MGAIFNIIVYKPIYNLLIMVYNQLPWHDFGVAIILVTLLIKFILWPINKKQIESQKKMQELQPKIKAVQDKHKNDKEKQSKAIMELYKEQKTNPLSGCLPMIIQLVFLIAFYRVLYNISSNNMTVDSSQLYSFVTNPGQINQYFLGIIDLSKGLDIKNLTWSDLPQIILVVMAALSQYVQTKMLMSKQENKAPESEKKGKETDFAQSMSKQMLYLGPLLTLFIGFRLPAGLSLYWLVSTVFTIGQQKYIEKKEAAKMLLKNDKS
jgi:YidC/Oxa1 family membrane protein insertase